MSDRDDGKRPSAADAALWRAAMAQAKPLARREEKARARVEPVPSHPKLVLGPAEGGTRGVEPVIAAGKRARATAAAPPPPQDLRAPRVAGLDQRTRLRLRRGLLPLEGRLDLHGMTRKEAHAALAAFLAETHGTGKRCVLVITGRGQGANSEGVLRREVPRWLREPPHRERVLAFVPARPKDGGEGALYVLLRRRRGEREP